MAHKQGVCQERSLIYFLKHRLDPIGQAAPDVISLIQTQTPLYLVSHWLS